MGVVAPFPSETGIVCRSAAGSPVLFSFRPAISSPLYGPLRPFMRNLPELN
jgi:hypothetical protein